MAYTRRKKYGRRRKSLRGGLTKKLSYGDLDFSMSPPEDAPIQKPVVKKRLPKENFNLSPDIEVIAQKRPYGFISPKTPEGEEYVYDKRTEALVNELRKIAKPKKVEKPVKVEEPVIVEEPEIEKKMEPVEVPVKKVSRKKHPSRRKHHPPRPQTKGRIPWGYRPGQYIPNRV